MYSATTGTFLQRDPLASDSGFLGYSHDAITDIMNSRRPDGFFEMDESILRNLYAYASGNPVNRIDPSGLACRPANPPDSAIPTDDDYNPVSSWRPQPASGYPIGFANSRVTKFPNIKCNCCTMDVEIVARAYRYYRYDTQRNRFVGYRGQDIGVSNDPRDFFSILVLTVCQTNIVCNGQRKDDTTTRLVTTPLQRDGRGVYIRQGQGDIETTVAAFTTTDNCDFAEDLIRYIQQNTRPGLIDDRKPQ